MEDRSSHLSLKRKKEKQQRKHLSYLRHQVSNILKARALRALTTALGMRSGGISEQAHKRKLASNNAWNKSHRKRMRLADKRYKAKIVAKYGSHGERAKWLWALNQRPIRAQKKKELAHEAHDKVLQLQKMWRREVDRRRSLGLPIGWRSPNKAPLRGAMAALTMQVAASLKKASESNNGKEVRNEVPTPILLGRNSGYAVAGRRKGKRKGANKG